MPKLFSKPFGLSFEAERGFIARTYGESLRDNFVGFTPTDPVRFAALRQELADEEASARPAFANLLRIEAALVDLLPEKLLMARYWMIEDRFTRVVPAAVRARREQHVPPRGDLQWKSPIFIRDQTRALLDAIQSNYIINMAREAAIKRLKFFLLAALGVALIVISMVFSFGGPLADAYALLFLAGLLGAILSVSQRLQTAVAHDAMTQDGLYELIGLRMGWVGVIISLVMGGVSALVIYAVVTGGLLAFAQPESNGIAPVTSAPAATAPVGNAPAKPVSASDQAAAPSAPPAVTPAVAAPPKPTLPTDPAAGAVLAKTRQAALVDVERARQTAIDDIAKIRTDALTPTAVRPCLMSTDNKNCAPLGTEITQALGLADFGSLCKMLILALIAGFAERLVPDILGRLNKRAGGS